MTVLLRLVDATVNVEEFAKEKEKVQKEEVGVAAPMLTQTLDLPTGTVGRISNKTRRRGIMNGKEV